MTSTPVTETQFPGYENKNATNMDSASCDEICIFYTVATVIISVLGVVGNGLVIWITGFKVKKTVVSTWYLSLAVSDFLFCSFLPFDIVNIVGGPSVFGSFMHIFMFFMKLLNWFSSMFLLLIISVDRCVVVMFPVWAQNQRTVRKASVIVVLGWIISAALTILAIFFFLQYVIALVVCDFILGFVIPFLVIVICYVLIIRKLNTNQMTRSKKPFKIMTALIVSFLICWLPYHTVLLMLITKTEIHSFWIILALCGVLANANSCLNPFLYAFMGKDFKKECSALLSKIESAVVEEEGHNLVPQTAITII